MRGVRTTTVVETDDRVVITTTPRRSEAILRVLAGATLTDVGREFGVSRERIRQYMKDAGLTVQQRQRFKEQSTKDQTRWSHVGKPRGSWLRLPRTERRARANRVARIVRAIRAATGNSPTIRQVALWIWPNCPKTAHAPHLIGYLSPMSRRRGMRILRVVWRMGGCEMRRPGGGDRDAISRAVKARWAAMSPEVRRSTIEKMHARRAA